MSSTFLRNDLRLLFQGAVPFLVLAACDGVTDPGCRDCLVSTEIRGLVRTELDEPVVGAAVRLAALEKPGTACISSPDLPTGIETETGPDGRFSVIIQAPARTSPRCLEVSVVPPPASNLITKTDTVDAVFVSEGEEVPFVEVETILFGDRYVEVEAGFSHTCALRIDGVVECWGENDDGQAPRRRKAATGSYTQVSSPGSDSCALRTDGVVECWGMNLHGGALPEHTAGDGFFIQVSTFGATCAVRSDGGVECWGSNFSGGAPAHKEPVSGSFTSVGLSSSHTCALRDDGVIECWGRDWIPSILRAPSGSFTQLDSGLQFTCAVTTDGVAVCRGADPWDLTHNPTVSPFVQVSGGWSHMCAVRADGAVECWLSTTGSGNEEGQAPPFVTAAEGVFTQVSAGAYHTCALRDDGVIECWGLNDQGQAPAVRRVGDP